MTHHFRPQFKEHISGIKTKTLAHTLCQRSCQCPLSIRPWSDAIFPEDGATFPALFLLPRKGPTRYVYQCSSRLHEYQIVDGPAILLEAEPVCGSYSVGFCCISAVFFFSFCPIFFVFFSLIMSREFDAQVGAFDGDR